MIWNLAWETGWIERAVRPSKCFYFGNAGNSYSEKAIPFIDFFFLYIYILPGNKALSSMHCNRNTKQKKKGGGGNRVRTTMRLGDQSSKSKLVSSDYLQNGRKISSAAVVEHELVKNILCYLLVISFILQSIFTGNEIILIIWKMDHFFVYEYLGCAAGTLSEFALLYLLSKYKTISKLDRLLLTPGFLTKYCHML